MIVHGTRDRMIPERHATELSQYFQGYCKVRLVSNMSHSLFNHDDFFSFVREFIQTLD
jgi:predicted esterase